MRHAISAKFLFILSWRRHAKLVLWREINFR